MFQSPCGVRGRSDGLEKQIADLQTEIEFQSPYGVKGGSDRYLISSTSSMMLKFQSPYGVRGRSDDKGR